MLSKGIKKRNVFLVVILSVSLSNGSLSGRGRNGEAAASISARSIALATGTKWLKNQTT